MKTFSPNILKSATAPITVTPANLSCQAALYFVQGGVLVGTPALVDFVSTGQSQNVQFSITTPNIAGIYDVYVDILCNDSLFASYISTEKVTISSSVGLAEIDSFTIEIA